MPTDVATLHLAQVDLDVRRIDALARTRGLPSRSDDTGYLVHCILGELFGELAPKPFRIIGSQGRTVSVLGHCDQSGEVLRHHAGRFADPVVHAACDWETLATKPYPTDWPSGSRLGFSVRCCPVVRKANAGPHHGKGAEVDAFVSRCWEVGKETPVQREAVYREWLAAQLDRRGGAKLVEARVERFQLRRLLRRDHQAKRSSREHMRPDVTLEGTIELTDGGKFIELLRGGLGRHRAFGFGLLLLRRP